MNLKPILLPKNMQPNQETFEKLGFTFLDYGHGHLFHATLPEGWTMARSDSYCSFIDEKGHERGRYFGDKEMILTTRYNANYDFDALKVFVKDLQNNKIIYTAERRSTSGIDRCETLLKLTEDVEHFLDTNYPDWDNPLKYWT